MSLWVWNDLDKMLDIFICKGKVKSQRIENKTQETSLLLVFSSFLKMNIIFSIILINKILKGYTGDENTLKI